jgi:RNA polymerase sigma factor (sigma-70 family)
MSFYGNLSNITPQEGRRLQSVSELSGFTKKLIGGTKMSKFKLCFILDNEGNYWPVPYSKLMDGKERKEEYADRYFLPLNGYLLEVSRDDYLDYYKNINRMGYIRNEARRAGEVSLDSFSTFDDAGFQGLYEDVVEIALSEIMIQHLHKAIALLDDNDQRLVKLLYFDEQTERQCAEIFGLSQHAIHSRKKRILKKLKNILES